MLQIILKTDQTYNRKSDQYQYFNLPFRRRILFGALKPIYFGLPYVSTCCDQFTTNREGEIVSMSALISQK